MSVGVRIRELRKKKNMTLDEFSAAIECSRDHLWKVETGRTPPSLSFIESVAAYVGVEFVPVFFDPGGPPLQVTAEGERVLLKIGDGGGDVREVSVDDQGRARPCPNCNEGRYGDRARYCPSCGWALFNFCISGDRHINSHEADRCELCGKPTWWSFESQEEVDSLGIPDDAHSSHSVSAAQETT